VPEFRKAEAADLKTIAEIYAEIHDCEESGKLTTGWLRGVYPTEKTAETSLSFGDMYVETDGGEIVASGRINRIQGKEYADADWKITTDEGGVLVLHTLTVRPSLSGRGYGTAFVSFYENLARSEGCLCLRIDTNAKNLAAQKLYAGLGYTVASVVPCNFNGIPDVMLVCLEKLLDCGIRTGRWRHFKGGEYEVLHIARHSETEEPMVVYRALYGERGVWVRPASMWLETVEREGLRQPRFTYIG